MRRRAGDSEIVVYGRRAVLEALDCNDVELIRVCASQRVGGELRRDLKRRCRQRGVLLESATPRRVSAMSGDSRNDQGIAAGLRLLRVADVAAFAEMQRGARARLPQRVIAIDGIENSQNVGMLLRSALAAGMSGVLWPAHGTPWVNGLVVKASAGTALRCPILRCDRLAEGLGELAGAGFEILGLEAGAEESLFSHRPPHRAVYVVGGENHGLSPLIQSLLDTRLAIPMSGGVESLNAAIAASLLCFHVSAREPASAPQA